MNKTAYQFDYVTNPSEGLGDCLSCFNTNRPIWSPSPHYSTLKKYSSIRSLDVPVGVGLYVNVLYDSNFGHEHLFNRVRIASGLEPLSEPRAILDLVHYCPTKTNIAFSLDAGKFANVQKHIHPRARELYTEHSSTIQEFISRNSDKFNFIEIGLSSSNLNNTINKTGITLDQTIKILCECQYYFGMHSGLMHLATAIGLKSTIIINFPTIEDFKSPDVCPDKYWLYPQHRYLHEDYTSGDYAITVENLESIWK